MKIAVEKNARILGLFAIVCTAVVGITFELTKDRIKQNKNNRNYLELYTPLCLIAFTTTICQLTA